MPAVLTTVQTAHGITLAARRQGPGGVIPSHPSPGPATMRAIALNHKKQ